MDSVIATVSGYHGSERFKLIKLISKAGASYVGAMNSSTTHLVCYKFEGKKYELARKFKTVVVNHRWIEECIKQGRRVSERPYTKHCGFEVGPLLLEIPDAGNEARSPFGEVSTTRSFFKTPVIDIECGDDADDAWTDSWLLKENLLPDMKQNKDRSNRSKKKGTKRCSTQDVLLTNKNCLEESSSFGLRKLESEHHVKPKRKNTTICESSKRSINLTHKSIRDELAFLSDSEEDVQHSNAEPKKKNTAICESSKRSLRLTHKSIRDELAFLSDSEEDSQHSNVEPKRKNTTICESSKRSLRLTHKNIRDELAFLSDSEEDFQPSNIQHNVIDISEPSNYSRKDENIRPHRTRSHNLGKRRNLILEEIEDLDTTSDNQDNSAGVDHDDCNKGEHDPKLSKERLLSCVICWTDFSSTRGVLPCGHRFCFSCIQNWADHMASMKKVSTCPLCKGSFYSIQKMEEAVSSDQKIYSQTIPNNCPITDVYILPHGESSTHQILPPPTPVCYQCCCREPEELLLRCHSCQIRCVHSYCLDPPQYPWVCVQCKDLRMRYLR